MQTHLFSVLCDGSVLVAAKSETESETESAESSRVERRKL